MPLVWLYSFKMIKHPLFTSNTAADKADVLFFIFPSHLHLLFISSISCSLLPSVFVLSFASYLLFHYTSLPSSIVILYYLFLFILSLRYVLNSPALFLFFIFYLACVFYSQRHCHWLFLSQSSWYTLWECEPSKGTERQNWAYYPSLPWTGAKARGKEGEYVFVLVGVCVVLNVRFG